MVHTRRMHIGHIVTFVLIAPYKYPAATTTTTSTTTSPITHNYNIGGATTELLGYNALWPVQPKFVATTWHVPPVMSL